MVCGAHRAPLCRRALGCGAERSRRAARRPSAREKPTDGRRGVAPPPRGPKCPIMSGYVIGGLSRARSARDNPPAAEPHHIAEVIGHLGGGGAEPRARLSAVPRTAPYPGGWVGHKSKLCATGAKLPRFWFLRERLFFGRPAKISAALSTAKM